MKIIKDVINDTIKIIDEALDKYTNYESTYQNQIYKSMRYSLFSGGKRLRPIIAIKTFELFNGDIDKVLPYAAAIEMIHTYSLIHDDLPAMDDDDFRRGKPTNHIVFGEALAILSGDGLLNQAFETMSNDLLNNSNSIEDYRKKSRVIYEVSKYAGVEGMIGGQVVDLFGTAENTDSSKLRFMYEKKTAALFQASSVAGAILGGARDEEVEILREFSLHLGLAFQIQDDILDSEEDASINKLTHLSFYDIEKSKEDVIQYTNKAFELLDRLSDKDTEFLRSLTNLLVYRKE
ncbi:MAG: polyprenyl synthetase family protein [Tissierellaceae bacterium]|nr:polyprenyl synthetase family protein [Tissierellaceae bacterium]